MGVEPGFGVSVGSARRNPFRIKSGIFSIDMHAKEVSNSMIIIMIILLREVFIQSSMFSGIRDLYSLYNEK